MENNKSRAGAAVTDNSAESVTAAATTATKTLFGSALARASKADVDNAGAASNFDGNNKTFNILKDYEWTLSQHKTRTDLPFIKLSEHRQTEGSIMTMLNFYGKGLAGSVQDVAGEVPKIGKFLEPVAATINKYAGANRGGLLTVYEDIFPDRPTQLKYVFPYFAKQYMELNTPNWTQTDGAASALGDAGGGASDAASKFDGLKGFSKALDVVSAATGFAGAIGELALKNAYPKVGVLDRPRIFASHSERGLNIEFPLYNTKNSEDWIRNVNFLNVFMTQNLFNKRDYITGYSPCYYRVLIPGQYFCFASCVTNIAVENLGNVRMMPFEKTKVAVPDAYQVKIQMTEMVMPSLNQFQAIFDGTADSKVQVEE